MIESSDHTSRPLDRPQILKPWIEKDNRLSRPTLTWQTHHRIWQSPAWLSSRKGARAISPLPKQRSNLSTSFQMTISAMKHTAHTSINSRKSITSTPWPLREGMTLAQSSPRLTLSLPTMRQPLAPPSSHRTTTWAHCRQEII